MNHTQSLPAEALEQTFHDLAQLVFFGGVVVWMKKLGSPWPSPSSPGKAGLRHETASVADPGRWVVWCHRLGPPARVAFAQPRDAWGVRT